MKSIESDDIYPILENGLDESNVVDVLKHKVLEKYRSFEETCQKASTEVQMSRCVGH